MELEKYINIPFETDGRSFDGANCWGLVMLMYLNELGIKLPSYSEVDSESLIKIYKEINKGKDNESWVDIPDGQQKPYDICVMSHNLSRLTCHVGVVIDKKTIIHIEKGIDSVIIPINHYTVRERIVCYRRHIKMMK